MSKIILCLFVFTFILSLIGLKILTNKKNVQLGAFRFIVYSTVSSVVVHSFMCTTTDITYNDI